MKPNYTEEPGRVKSFQERIVKDSGGNCIVIPRVFLYAEKGYEGNVRHLVHDFVGSVKDQNESLSGSIIEALVPPTLQEKFENAVKEAQYIKAARVHGTSTNVRIIKN